ncbi:cobalamin biosynthesis protein [Methyloligella halotolerans]|uniref:Cobalamin biosynthesis protein CobD n=1 Tax=Methyloligella halotolerans TaxID=1177755 RepID=A0A1E2S192_9HYPH|nr:adenosylcobinamide-phosphate synthase CbiB [Methyloligella halotolerans]ODA68273.1 cobalamin biosynthesis protein [Methyloligella halotolerans]
MFALLTLFALAFDAGLGYPAWLFARIGHPVSWIGWLITWCEQRWNGPDRSAEARRLAGLGTLLLCLTVVLAATLCLVLALDWLLPSPVALVLLGLFASSLIAQRSLDDHVAAVAAALDGGSLHEARRAVSRIVGRDPQGLDSHAIARAAIESLAENFSDGVTAPAFWMVIAGLPGAALYKTVNTADSMIGHRNARYESFGWASARLDDLANLPASRITAVSLAAAAALLPWADGAGALRSVRRDAGRHRSPNAGWPEAAMAGALGLRLAGPRVYGGKTVEDHWMGDGRADADSSDVRRALILFRTAALLQATVVGLLALLLVSL